MKNYQQTDSPIGVLTLIEEDQKLVAVYMSEHRHVAANADFGEMYLTPLLERVRGLLDAYFAGQVREFDVPLSPQGTAFQLRVWAELQRIPYGTTISYGELARRIGDPNASRAVGLANGKNPVSILIPCHRVIGASGKLVGYGGGLDRKAHLLRLEQQVAGQLSLI